MNTLGALPSQLLSCRAAFRDRCSSFCASTGFMYTPPAWKSVDRTLVNAPIGPWRNLADSGDSTSTVADIANQWAVEVPTSATVGYLRRGGYGFEK